MQEPPPLPPTAQVLADVIGRELTLKLASRARYRAIVIPYRLRDNHWITQTVGRPAADRLVRYFGGLHMPLAKCKCVFDFERDSEIRRAHTKGEPVPAIAGRFRISERHVWRIVSTK